MAEPNTIFVGRLAWSLDEARLASAFAQFGQIQSTKIIRDRQTGRSKGFGYVEFATAAEAKAALSLHGTEIDGFAINVDLSQPRNVVQSTAGGPMLRREDSSPQASAAGNRSAATNAMAQAASRPPSEPSTTVFVGNLSFAASERDLWTAFSACGLIKAVRLPRYHDTGKMKGYAYVEFEDIASATRCVEMGRRPTADDANPPLIGAGGGIVGGASICGRPVRLDFTQPRVAKTDAPAGADILDGQMRPDE